MLSILYLFLAFEGAMLIAAAIYVGPLTTAHDRRTQAVMIKPELPRAVAIPTKWRRERGE